MIDDGLSAEWPAEVVDAVRNFRQGSLVERPPLFYQGSPAHPIWDVSRSSENADTEELIALADTDRPEFGLITTQTCDIVEEGKPDHPWVQIAPVYQLLDVPEEELQRLTKHMRGHLVLLDPPDLPSGVWVVDLRVEVPVEKGWLVGRRPIASYSSEDGYVKLGNRIGASRDRPALATTLMDSVVKPLRNWLQGSGGLKASQRVDELRLNVGPDLMAPDRAGVLVLSDTEPLSKDERIPWEKWWDRTRPRAGDVGIDLIANRYESFDSISARDYRNSVELNFRYLSGGG